MSEVTIKAQAKRYKLTVEDAYLRFLTAEGTYDKVMHALERAVAQHFDTYYGYIDPDQTAMLYMMRAQSLSNLDGLYSYYSLYPKYSHGFVATVPMYTPAGSGMYWTDVQVDPDKR